MTDKVESERCFRDAVENSTPRKLRSLFVMLTTNGFPTTTIYNKPDLLERMMIDYIHTTAGRSSIARATNLLLQDLAKRFRDVNKSLSDYGFPEPTDVETEVDEARLQYDPNEQRELLESLQQSSPNNVDQQHAYDVITDAIRTRKGGIFIILGQVHHREMTSNTPLRISHYLQT